MALELKKVNWWHEQVVDWMLANPDKTLKEAALVFDCTKEYMYMMTNSDAFKEYRKRRFTDHQELLSLGILEKAEGLTSMALDELAEKVSEGNLSPKMLLDVVKVGFEAAGVNGKFVPSPTNQTNIFISTPKEVLIQAREKAARLKEEEEVIEGEIRDS